MKKYQSYWMGTIINVVVLCSYQNTIHKTQECCNMGPQNLSLTCICLCAIIHNIILGWFLVCYQPQSEGCCQFLCCLPVTCIMSLSGACHLLRCHACWLGQGSGTHLIKALWANKFCKYSCCFYVKENNQIRSYFCTGDSSWAGMTHPKLGLDWIIIFPIKSTQLLKRFGLWAHKYPVKWVSGT